MSYIILLGGHLLFDRSPRVHVYVLRHQTFTLPLVCQIHLALNIIFLCLIQHLLVLLQGSQSCATMQASKKSSLLVLNYSM